MSFVGSRVHCIDLGVKSCRNASICPVALLCVMCHVLFVRSAVEGGSSGRSWRSGQK